MDWKLAFGIFAIGWQVGVLSVYVCRRVDRWIKRRLLLEHAKELRAEIDEEMAAYMAEAAGVQPCDDDI